MAYQIQIKRIFPLSNTLQRILSSIVMLTLVFIAVKLGNFATFILWILVSIFCLDEISCNFFKQKRGFHYLLFILGFLLLCFLPKEFKFTFLMISILANIFGIYYLFTGKIEDKIILKLSQKSPWLVLCFFVPNLITFLYYFNFANWKEILILLLVVTFSMDTGAWFFGKNFGKRKLWPAVSPKKTFEGLFGGMFTSMLLGSIVFELLFHQFSISYAILFCFFGAMAQLGDLLQSKIKREFGIKDSSHLIPGHGGIYDRIDGLIFLSPFFGIVVKYLGV